MKEGKSLSLDEPGDARTFLRGVKVKGKRIDFIVIGKPPHTKQLSIEELTDEQVVRYAKDVYFDFCGGVEGEGGFIELEGVNQ